MARAKPRANGRLEEAMALLIQNQAALLQNMTAFLTRMTQIDARTAEMDRINSERFARIEAILIEHSRILRALPDTIGDKIGFKVPEQPPASQ